MDDHLVSADRTRDSACAVDRIVDRIAVTAEADIVAAGGRYGEDQFRVVAIAGEIVEANLRSSAVEHAKHRAIIGLETVDIDDDDVALGQVHARHIHVQRRIHTAGVADAVTAAIVAELIGLVAGAFCGDGVDRAGRRPEVRAEG